MNFGVGRLLNKTNKWMIEQINLEFSFKAQMIRLKLFYFRHILQKLSSLEKATAQGKLEGKRQLRAR